MHPKTFFALFALLTLPFFVAAQTRVFFDKYFRPVGNGQPYTYYQDVYPQPNDQVLIKVFKKDGSPVSEGAYSSFGNQTEQVEEGIHRFYHDNNKPWYQVEYKAGIKDGMLASWYPSGKSKRVEYFKNGASTGGECYDEAGNPIPFTPFWQVPRYKKGDQALETLLRSKMKYPKYSYDYGLEGTVEVAVSVMPDGTVIDTRVLTSVSWDCDAEALRLIGLLKEWEPGSTDDVKELYSAVIPIRFDLKEAAETSKKAPGTKRFELIQEYIDSGKSFYITYNRKLVSAKEPYLYRGEASSLPNGNVHVKFYTNDGKLGKQEEYTCYTTMFERSVTPAPGVSYANDVSEEDKMLLIQLDENHKAIPHKKAANPADSTRKEVVVYPQFPGGDINLMKYILRGINYPTAAKEENIQGRVRVEFVVDKTGRVINVMILEDIGHGCGEEVVRLIRKMPQWTPCTLNGEPISVRFDFPMRFRLD